MRIYRACPGLVEVLEMQVHYVMVVLGMSVSADALRRRDAPELNCIRLGPSNFLRTISIVNSDFPVSLCSMEEQYRLQCLKSRKKVLRQEQVALVKSSTGRGNGGRRTS